MIELHLILSYIFRAFFFLIEILLVKISRQGEEGGLKMTHSVKMS